MNSTLIVAVIIVTCALITYSVFIFTKQKQGVITPFVLAALSLGVSLDIIATAVMIMGSTNMPFTAHGMLGYSALAGMLVDTVLIWRHWRSERKTEPVSRNLHIYTWIAYSWWVVAYIVGGMLAALSAR